MYPYIGLCGIPGAGKSEVQSILEDLYGVVPVDDGHCLREFAVNVFGLAWDMVTTQEGKASEIEVCGQKMTVRKFLGDLGQALEDKFGEHFMPEAAMLRCQALDVPGPFSFGSVRKTQGAAIRRAGGIVIEIRRPGIAPSPHAFDKYDISLVDASIVNDGTLKDLRAKVEQLWAMLELRAAA